MENKDQNCDPKYWENLLAHEGMPAKLSNTQEKMAKHLPKGTKVVDFHQEFQDVRAMQDLTDDQIEQENLFGDPVLAKDGLPPCLRLKKHREEQKNQ